MLSKKQEYLIKELAEKSHVTVRTIRYYIQEGLLPAPNVKGRYSVYDEDYLYRIELIKLLKKIHLPLREIKQQIETLSKEEVIGFIQKLSQTQAAKVSEPTSPTGSQYNNALEYINNLLSQQPSIASISDSAPASQRPLSARSTGYAPISSPASPVEQSRWQRIRIHEGIELHIDEGLSDSEKAKVFQLLDFATQLFSK